MWVSCVHVVLHKKSNTYYISSYALEEHVIGHT